MQRLPSAVFLIAIVSGFSLLPGAAQQGFLLKPEKFQIQGTFWEKKRKPAKDLSGIACIDTKPAKHCLAINDESLIAQLLQIEGDTLIVDETLHSVRSPAPIGKAPNGEGCTGGPGNLNEIDGEAVAFFDSNFYIFGSHGCTRGKSAFKVTSFLVSRLTVNVSADGKTVSVTDLASSYRLAEVFAKTKGLMEYFAIDLEPAPDSKKLDGLNIEGAVIIDRALYIGLRAPLTAKGEAIIVKIADVTDLFEEKRPLPDAELVPVELNVGAGIRDLSALKDGRIIILSGPHRDRKGIQELFVFDPKTQSKPQLIGTLQFSDEKKAEAITVMQEDEGSAMLILMFEEGDAYRLSIPLRR